MRPHDERLGLLFAGLCAMNGAFVPAFAKLTSDRADPVVVATATSLCAGIAALVVGAFRGELGLLVARRHRTVLAALGALGTALAYVCLFEGTRRTSAIEMALCLQIEPVYAFLGSWLVLGHRPTPRRAAAIAVLLTGIALAIDARSFSSAVGVVLLLATPLCWQLSHLLVLRRLAGVPPPVLTSARFVYGGLLLAVLVAVTGARPADLFGAQLPALAFQGVVLSYLGTMIWYGAIARLDLTRTTAIVVPSIPLLSLAASFLLLGEVPTARQWLGLGLAGFGVLVFVTAPHAVDARTRIPLPTIPLAAPSEDRTS